MDFERYATELFEVMNRMQKESAEHTKMLQDIMQGELAVLGFIFDCGGSTAPTDLSGALCRTTARIANTLNSLEKKGYIERMHDPVDRRRVVVYITDSGELLLQNKKAEIIQRLTALMMDLGEEDAAEYLRLERRAAELLRINGED